MHRIDGYIDILKLLSIELSTELDGTDQKDYEASLEIYDKLCSNDKVHILKHELGIRILFSFEYEGAIYYFKYESLTKPTRELFAYEAASRLGLNCVPYDLAILGPYRGVISKNFKDPTAHYIEGLDVLVESYPEYLKDYSDETDENYVHQCILRDYCELNSLESIWNAFSIRYKNRVDCDQIVENLMNKIVDIFIFDLLLGQVDRTAANWYLVEYPNGLIDLGPILDNARIFFMQAEISKTSLTVSTASRFVDVNHVSLENNVREFLRKSDASFRNKLIGAMNILNPDVVQDMLSSIEARIGRPLNMETKNLYLSLCANQKAFLEETLKPERKFTM